MTSKIDNNLCENKYNINAAKITKAVLQKEKCRQCNKYDVSCINTINELEKHLPRGLIKMRTMKGKRAFIEFLK